MYAPEELENLNADGPPLPKTKKEPNEIMRLFHVAVNEPDVICCVCDQFRIKARSCCFSPTIFFFKLKQLNVNVNANYAKKIWLHSY